MLFAVVDPAKGTRFCAAYNFNFGLFGTGSCKALVKTPSHEIARKQHAAVEERSAILEQLKIRIDLFG
jgi:hypothetical protein